MKKLLLTGIVLAFFALASCSAADPLDDLYTKDIYPGNGDYQIGDNASRFSQGWFDWLYADNATILELWVADNASIHTLDGSVFGSTSGATALADMTDIAKSIFTVGFVE